MAAIATDYQNATIQITETWPRDSQRQNFREFLRIMRQGELFVREKTLRAARIEAS